MGSDEETAVAIRPTQIEGASLVEMIIRHEARIQDIESGMGKLNDLTLNTNKLQEKTNHHLCNMRNNLGLLKIITEEVEEIGMAVKKNETEIEQQKKDHKNHRKAVESDVTEIKLDVHHVKNHIDSIGPWVKWGVSIIIAMAGIFFTSATALKILG